MSNLPDVRSTIADGGTGAVPNSLAKASVKIGICSAGTPNTLTSGFSDIATMQAALGQGPLVEALAHHITIAGGPVYAMAANPSSAGTVGSTTQTGTGLGTVTGASATSIPFTVKISTAGTIGTMAFQVSMNGGAYGSPVTSSGTTFAYTVPGTLTIVTFAAGTYVLNSTYAVAADGTITRGGSAINTVTQASSPFDSYIVNVKVSTAGAIGAGAFQYSLDGGNNYSAAIGIPGSAGIYALPNSGVYLTFANNGGAFVLGDVYTFTCTPASFSTSDVTAALNVLKTSSVKEGFFHIVGAPSSASGAATLASTVDTSLTGMETIFRYDWGLIECPSSESDATIESAFANFSSKRVAVGVGDFDQISPITGRIIRRNAAWQVAARAAQTNEGVDIAWVGFGSLSLINALYRDEQATEGLDAARFCTLRTYNGRAGYYITNGRTMAPEGSDFSFLRARRVMDTACRITRIAELPYVNGNVRVDKTTGFIDERDAQQFERTVNAELDAALVATRNASSSSVVMSRTTNIISTSSEPVTIKLVPNGYLENIENTIGFSNPALGN